MRTRKQISALPVIAGLVAGGLLVYFLFVSNNGRDSSKEYHNPVSGAVEIPPAEASNGGRGKGAEAIETRANASVVFYGEVVDHNEAPLSGVTVYCRVSGEGLGGAGGATPEMTRFTVTTGNDGRFTVDGRRGAFLGIEKLVKENYFTLANAGNSFAYAGTAELHAPDVSKPVRFIMASRNQGAEVVQWNTRLDLKWEGIPGRYELATGKASPSGELEIIPRRKRFVEQQPRDFDWCFDMRLHRGGLVFVDPRRGAVAPAEGYAEMISVGRGYADRSRMQTVTSFTVCAKTKAGTYGLLQLSIRPDSRETSPFAGRMEGLFNKSGSRILFEGKSQAREPDER